MINLQDERHEIMQSNYDLELKLERDIRRAYERAQKAMLQSEMAKDKKDKQKYTKIYNTYYSKFLHLNEELNNLRKKNNNINQTSHKAFRSRDDWRRAFETIFKNINEM